MRSFFITLLSILSCTDLFGQQYQWAKGGGTSDAITGSYTNEGSYYMCTDQNKNVYSLNIIGSHSTMIADTFTHGSTPFVVSNNILITSYNCNGVMRWAKLLTCSAYDAYPIGIAVDRSGHVYLGGVFLHQVGNFSIGYDTTIATGNQCAATIQLDTNGHFNWIRWIGPNTVANRIASSAGTGSIALDKQQNLHFIKMFKSGSQITSSVLTAYGTYDVVFDATGNILGATRLQLDSTLQVEHASIDTLNGKLYVTGGNNNSITWSQYASYAAAFDLNRSVLWQDTVQSPLYASMSATAYLSSVVTDGIGHVYFSGNGFGSAAFGGDTVTNTPYGPGGTGFILKTDTLGNAIWMRAYASSLSICQMNAITMMPNNKVAASGDFVGTILSGSETITEYSGESQNVFFTVLDTSGNVQALQQPHGPGNPDASRCISADNIGNVYVGGYVASSIWGGSMTPYTSLGGNTDFFVMKYGVDCNCTSMPMASFTYSGSPTVTFTYTGTTAGIDSVRWYFDDGGTATTFSPTHTYTAAGIYHVTVRIYSACGNDVRFATITIPCVTTPVCSFTSTGLSATRNFTYTGTPAVPDSVAWTFGDGGHATGLTVSHTYASTGTFNVCATVYTPCGNITTCSTVTITCTSTLAAAYTHSGYTPVGFTYTGTTTGLDSVVWHYGDGGHGTGLTSSHSYATIGMKTACVLAYNHCGVDSSCSTFNVPCIAAPVAAFTSTGTTATRNFTYTGTAVGLDSVVWNFGDGGHAVGNTAIHTYATTGIFNVCVTAYSPCGSNTYCSSISVTCITGPTASFTNAGVPTTTFTYTGTTTGLDSVVWRYGDGGNGTGVSSVHSYTIGGTYTACVLAYNHCGWDSACTTIVVPCVPPVANFSNSGTLVQNFTYTGTAPGIDSIVWTYGDGNTDTGYTANHTYTTEGTYHVCVMAYSYCAADTQCNDIVITCPPPVAAITNNNDTFHYTGTTPTIDSIVWDFGDGFTDTGMSPVHPYAVTDTYHVCVRVYGYCGADTLCSDFIVTGVGISMISLADVSVYPNPATNQVNIEGVTTIMNYRLVSVTGVTLQQGDLQQGVNRVNMGNYSPGVYMIELIGGDGSRKTFRVVKE